MAGARQRRGEDAGRITVLRKKAPRWNEALGAFCLNFGGRVTRASVKNFQLVADEDAEHVVLQFGKARPPRAPAGPGRPSAGCRRPAAVRPHALDNAERRASQRRAGLACNIHAPVCPSALHMSVTSACCLPYHLHAYYAHAVPR
jgi:hypothetical protein